jgi:CheY-like chemotaxis protein
MTRLLMCTLPYVPPEPSRASASSPCWDPPMKDRARAREAGFDAHITKPATADVLRRVLSET